MELLGFFYRYGMKDLFGYLRMEYLCAMYEQIMLHKVNLFLILFELFVYLDFHTYRCEFNIMLDRWLRSVGFEPYNLSQKLYLLRKRAWTVIKR